MFRLILLDDEDIVIKGIQKVFDLNAFGFEIVGTFNNPTQALAQIEFLKPDLIITDVKMPGMDGLEFSTLVKQQLPDSEIVILSGYDDFSYAQTAVKLGVSDYLLKPIKKDDFKQMLMHMHQKIKGKLAEKQYYQSLQTFAENNIIELKNRFFLSLAESEVFDEQIYLSLQKRWKTNLLDEPFVLIKVDIYRLEASGDYMSELGKITQQLLEELTTYCKVEDFLSDESLFFFLYQIPLDSVEDIICSVRAYIDAKQQDGIQIAMGISQIHYGLKALFAARNDCIRQLMLSEVNLGENNDIIFTRKDEPSLSIPYTEMENLFRSISVGETMQIRESIEKIYYFPKNAVHLLYRDYSISITFLILLRMCQIQNKYDPQQHIIPQEWLDMKNLRKKYPTVEGQKELIGNTAFLLSDLIAQQEIAVPSKLVLSALDYINKHFSENISLSDVASDINISKSYLCDIFKKELGVTFINYVTNLRIERAKEYLSTTDMKMYEVSNAVGYSDYAYFSQIFKKQTGTTLSEYRRQH